MKINSALNYDHEDMQKVAKAVEKAERSIATGRCNWANQLYELVEDINKVINPIEPINEEVDNASH